MIVCICKNISDKEIKAELNNGINSLCDLKRALGVATKCGMCECEVKQIVCTDKLNPEQGFCFSLKLLFKPLLLFPAYIRLINSIKAID